MSEPTRELPSDRMVRGWYRKTLYLLGLCCLIGGTLALLDGHAAIAAAAAAMGLVWVVTGRLLFPV